MSALDPVHVRSDERETLIRPAPLPTLQRLLGADTGAQSLTVLVNKLLPGQQIPPHRHDVEEVLLVTEGGCTVRAGDAEFTPRAGDAVIVPPGVVHEVHAADDRAGQVIGVLASSTPLFEPVDNPPDLPAPHTR